MKKFLLFFTLMLLCVHQGAVAQSYPVSAIPLGLIKDAYAVVRESSEEFIQADKYNGTYKVTEVITVLNNNGQSYANLFISEDDFTELKSFSGELFDAAGKQIKKISRKDLTTTAYSTSLADAGKKTFYEVYSPTYPYTVKYTYEMKYKNGILIYPVFRPQYHYNTAVEKASYTLQVPSDIEVRIKQVNTTAEPIQSTVKDKKVYTLSMNNLPALVEERFAPTDELIPVVYLSPGEFCVEKACGNMSTWESFGAWELELLKGRDVLPQKITDEVKRLTNGITDKREITKILYEYMQRNTHYVSIQLGIGGWQPMPASEVAATGFGDCKALSNYMMALLKAVDIPSYYSVIRMGGKKTFFRDFPSFAQANHVVLMVPMENDSIWLECTSQIMPFGYIHDRIAGHDALCVGDDKSFLATVPEYPPMDSRESNKINIRVSETGHAEFDIHSTYYLDRFESVYSRLQGMNTREEKDFWLSMLKIPKPEKGEIARVVNLGERPRMEVDYPVSCEDYASRTGSRMFIPVNPAYTSLKGVITGKTRQYDILLPSGFYQTDTINLYIPEGYTVETKPAPLTIDSRFGSFSSTFEEKTGGALIYTQTIELPPGRYPASDFEDMKAFFNQVENAQTRKMGLKQ